MYRAGLNEPDSHTPIPYKAYIEASLKFVTLMTGYSRIRSYIAAMLPMKHAVNS